MGKRWNKFHPLFGADLKVGFETTFPRTVASDGIEQFYAKSGLVHNPPDEPIIRVYEPATEILGSCKEGDAAQVFFEPVSLDGSLFRRLVFARKVDHCTGKPRRWMIAARHGELFHFGFDSQNSRSEKYLSLAYTGLEESFIPVYVKIQEKGEEEEFVYLEVWAWDENGGRVVAQARRVSEEEVPQSLLKLPC